MYVWLKIGWTESRSEEKHVRHFTVNWEPTLRTENHDVTTSTTSGSDRVAAGGMFSWSVNLIPKLVHPRTSQKLQDICLCNIQYITTEHKATSSTHVCDVCAQAKCVENLLGKWTFCRLFDICWVRSESRTAGQKTGVLTFTLRLGTKVVESANGFRLQGPLRQELGGAADAGPDGGSLAGASGAGDSAQAEKGPPAREEGLCRRRGLGLVLGRPFLRLCHVHAGQRRSVRLRNHVFVH